MPLKKKRSLKEWDCILEEADTRVDYLLSTGQSLGEIYEYHDDHPTYVMGQNRILKDTLEGQSVIIDGEECYPAVGTDKVLISRSGKAFDPVTHKPLKPHIDHKGYNVIRAKCLHRLVAMTFMENPENKSTVNHMDGDKNNSSLDNLEWTTHWENDRHSRLTGLRSVLLKPEQVQEVCRLLTEGKSVYYISSKLGLSKWSVKNVKQGAAYFEQTDRYNTHGKGVVPLRKQEGTIKTDRKTVVQICEQLQAGISNQKIASSIGVHPDVVAKIKSRKNWKEVSKDYIFPKTRFSKNAITSIKAHHICQELERGDTPEDVAVRHGVDTMSIVKIRSGVKWKSIASQYFSDLK